LAAGHDGAIWLHHPLVALGRRLGSIGKKIKKRWKSTTIKNYTD